MEFRMSREISFLKKWREVVKILGEAYVQAKKVLEKNLPRMEKVTNALLEKETLDEEEFRKLVG